MKFNCKLIVPLVALLLVSTNSLSDAYKCRLANGRVSYQEISCPRTATQDVVRIHGDSARIDSSSRAAHNRWVAALQDEQRRRDQQARERNERRKLYEEKMITSALIDKRDKANCEKYTALLEKRLKQNGIEVVNSATGDLEIDKSVGAMEMIDSTREAMLMYCG